MKQSGKFGGTRAARRSVVLLFISVCAVSAQLRPPPSSDVGRLLAMTPEQRERILEKLPLGRQEALRKRFEQFDRRPAAERARLLHLWKQMESLPEEKRELLTRQMQAFNRLPQNRKIVVRRAFNNLSKLTPEEREKRLGNPAFKGRFTPAELQMLSDLTENYPLVEK